jgi:hypothetical protein
MSENLQTNIDSQSETNETKKFNDNVFDGTFEPTSDIKHILGKTVKINKREKFKVDHHPNNKFDKIEEDGRVWKYTVSTVEKLDAPVKGETKQVSKWYVTEGHYNQLDKVAPDGVASTVDKMLSDGIVMPEFIPCKIKGGKFGKYYSWLTPDAYKKFLKEDKILIE